MERWVETGTGVRPRDGLDGLDGLARSDYWSDPLEFSSLG